jgi:hypothetical protein
MRLDSWFSAIATLAILGCAAPVVTPVVSNGAALHHPTNTSPYHTQGGRFGGAAKVG